MTMLEIGNSMSVPIEAKLPWNVTGVELVAGQTYVFEATGTWVDWYNCSGPDGYTSTTLLLKACERLRRMRRENWFALIGAIDCKGRTLFKIGTRLEYTAPESGILTCFANDMGYMYWNNTGAVTLKVTRTG